MARLRRDAGPAGAARPALLALFKASTDAGDRRALYEIRFGRRAEGAFDWIADGEAEWTRQENFAGAGQTTAQIEAAIAAGGPGTAEAGGPAARAGPRAPRRGAGAAPPGGWASSPTPSSTWPARTPRC